MSEPQYLSGRYLLVRRLGAGGSGVVWLVEDRHHPGAHFALKQLAPGESDRADNLRREFATLKRLRHVNLVEVHELEVGSDEARPFFTLEYIDGEDLVAAVGNEGPSLLTDLAAEALRALSFLHDFGLIHRDLKPGNLLVRRRPRLGSRLVLLDFGLALDDEPDGESAAQAPAGTLTYMAPELFEAARPSVRSDLYALGVVLFEAVHGRPPFAFDESDVSGFIESVRQGRRSRPGVPAGYAAGLSGWIDELLQPDPAHRPASASEALARLNAACGTRFPAETAAGRAARLGSGAPPGRESEIRDLWNHLASSNEPRLIWLSGAEGSGKRRVASWLAGDAVARDWEVVVSPPELFAETGSRPESTGLDDLLHRLRSRAHQRNTLVLLQDVESAPARVVDFLERVAREGKLAPLRVVAALNPAEIRNPALGRLLGHTGRVPTLRRVDLEALNTEGMAALIERATATRSISQAKLRWLMEASEGNPQIAETLLVDGAWERGGRMGADAAANLSISRRLERLPTACTRLLETLAVVGTDVPESLAASITDLSLDAAGEAAAELSALGLIRTTDFRWSVGSRTLAREVLGRMDADVRRERYRRAAECLDARKGAVGDFDRARLWSGAGDVRRAVRLATRAAASAENGDDPATAAERYAFALRHSDRTDPGRLDLRRRQAAALRKANLPQAAARALGACARLAREPAERADILARQASMLVQAGRFERALAAANTALELVGDAADERHAGHAGVRGRAKEAVGIALSRLGRGPEARAYLLDAVDEFRSIDEPLAQAHAMQALALGEANEGLPDAREHFREAIRLFERAEARGAGLINHVGLAVLDQRAGHYQAAREQLESIRRTAIERHNLLMEAVTVCTLAQNFIFQDRHADAIAFSRESEDQALHLGDDRLIFASRSARAQALIRCGRPAEAAALLESTLEIPHGKVDPVMVEYVRLARVEAVLASPEPDEDELRERLAESLDRARALRDPDTLLWALILELERRARPTVDEPLRPVRAELDTLADRGGSWMQPHYRIRARIAAARDALEGDAATAEPAAREALDLARKLDLPALAASSSDLLAHALEALDRPTEATAAVDEARRFLGEAADRIADTDLRRGFVERRDFDRLRRSTTAGRLSMDRRLLALYDMIRVLNSEQDPQALLESILDMALDVVAAERGMILLRDAESTTFEVSAARNLEKETVAEAEEFSKRFFDAEGSAQALLTADARHDERFQDLKSVSLYGIQSLMCVPLLSRGSLIGSVYLDNRGGGRVFNRGDLNFLEAFAHHAALALENARTRERLEHDNRRLQAVAEARVQFGNLAGQSPSMQEVFQLIGKVSGSELPALIQGESGTGKELVARAIHFNGSRRKRAFITENCAALPDTLLQTELFGHARGAFTGAERDRPGLFEQADGGTLFLDEVGDMSPNMQAQLLRVLEEGVVRRVGDERSFRVDVRLIAATHRDLQQEVDAGRFREDLMYRLQVIVVHLPPLRERPGDIAILADYLLERISRARGRAKPALHRDVMELLERFPWPGNVRQLENSLQRLALLAGDGPISSEVLDMDPALGEMLSPKPTATHPSSLERSELDRIRQALGASRGNRSQAARLLGISRATMYRKIKAYGL